jgi:hypothetical protein
LGHHLESEGEKRGWMMGVVERERERDSEIATKQLSETKPSQPLS